MSGWKDDLKWSTKAFIEFAWPKTKEIIGGKIIVVEKLNEALAKALDNHAGFDILHISDSGIRGIASRVQYDRGIPGYPFPTFTIRKDRDTGTKTEYQKRLDAIKNNFMYPYWTIQSYLSKDKKELVAGAIALTSDIIGLVTEEETNNTTNANFYIVRWSKIEANNCWIKYLCTP